MSHFLYFLGLFVFFLLLKTTEKNCVLCFRCVTCATWWHGGRKWNTPCATCRRRSSTYRYNYWKRTLLEVREKKYPVIWTHQCKNLLPLTHCSAVAKAANTHSVHLKKNNFFFIKLKYITVTSKPLLTECSGWTVLEMACHHFCTAHLTPAQQRAVKQ